MHNLIALNRTPKTAQKKMYTENWKTTHKTNKAFLSFDWLIWIRFYSSFYLQMQMFPFSKIYFDYDCTVLSLLSVPSSRLLLLLLLLFFRFSSCRQSCVFILCMCIAAMQIHKSPRLYMYVDESLPLLMIRRVHSLTHSFTLLVCYPFFFIHSTNSHHQSLRAIKKRRRIWAYRHYSKYSEQIDTASAIS